MMTNTKVMQATTFCLDRIRGSEMIPPDHRDHLMYMCGSICGFMVANQREKAMRWLGFVQGALWLAGIATIEEMKEVNRPDPEST